MLDELFGAAMKKADVRIDSRHHLAVEFQYEPQNAMRSGMLRAKVDREVTDLRFGHRLLSTSLLRPASHRREESTQCLPRGRGSRRNETPASAAPSRRRRVSARRRSAPRHGR